MAESVSEFNDLLRTLGGLHLDCHARLERSPPDHHRHENKYNVDDRGKPGGQDGSNHEGSPKGPAQRFYTSVRPDHRQNAPPWHSPEGIPEASVDPILNDRFRRRMSARRLTVSHHSGGGSPLGLQSLPGARGRSNGERFRRVVLPMGQR